MTQPRPGSGINWGQSLVDAVTAGLAAVIFGLIVASIVVKRQSTAQRKMEERHRKLDEMDGILNSVHLALELYLTKSVITHMSQNVPDIYYAGHRECSTLLARAETLSLTDRILTRRYCRRMYGTDLVRTVDDTLPETARINSIMGQLGYRASDGDIELITSYEVGMFIMDATQGNFRWMYPNESDVAPAIDYSPRRGIVNVHRIALTAAGNEWADPHLIARASATRALGITKKFQHRHWWHVLYTNYRLKGARPWHVGTAHSI